MVIIIVYLTVTVTCHITGLDLNDVGGELHHYLLIDYSRHLTDHGPLGSSRLGQPILVGEHRNLLCGQVTHDHLERQSQLNQPGIITAEKSHIQAIGAAQISTIKSQQCFCLFDGN